MNEAICPFESLSPNSLENKRGTENTGTKEQLALIKPISSTVFQTLFELFIFASKKFSGRSNTF